MIGFGPRSCPGSISALLDEGTITFDGEFFKYSALFTFARPVQQRVPLSIGAMRGPKSFEAAGELADGCHHALSYTREAYDYAVEHIRIGAERAPPRRRCARTAKRCAEPRS